MKRTSYTVSAAALTAAWLFAGTAMAQQDQGKSEQYEKIRPRSRVGTGPTPLRDNGQLPATVEKGRANTVQDVMEAQTALKEKGFDPGPIDGIMGQNTRESLKKFQRENDLKPTGTLNTQTAEKLGVNFGGPSDRAADVERMQTPQTDRSDRATDVDKFKTPLRDK